MAQDVKVQLDTKEFQRFLTEYAAASGKSISEAVTHQCRNWCLQSARIAKKANAGSIRATAKAEPLIQWTARKITEKNSGIKFREARRIAKKKLSDRRRSIGFIRAFLLTLANAGQGFGSFTGLTGAKVQTATPGNQTAELSASYGYKKRSGTTAKKAESIMQRIMVQGMAATVRDIESYLAKKLGRS